MLISITQNHKLCIFLFGFQVSFHRRVILLHVNHVHKDVFASKLDLIAAGTAFLFVCPFFCFVVVAL